MGIFNRKGVFPSQVEDEDNGSKEAWDNMQRMLGGIATRLDQLEKKSRAPVKIVEATKPAPVMKLHKPEVDLAGLPDPVTDKDGFIAGVSKRLQTQMDTLMATMKGQQEDQAAAGAGAAQLNAKVAKLWKRWTKEHPEFAKAGKLVQAEASGIIQEALALGTSLEEAMFSDEDGFLDTLAERVGEELKSLGVVPPKDPKVAADEVDKDLARFDGMFGGQGDRAADEEARGKDLAAGDVGSLTPRKTPGKETPINLTDQIKKAQEHMGLR